MRRRRLDRSNPQLKNLLLPREIRIGLELEHPSGKVFDIRVIAVIQTTLFANALKQAAPAIAVISEVRLSDEQRRKIRIPAPDGDRMADRKRNRPRLLLH